ncbi:MULTISPECIES: hypothetical protein [unclassified Rathayibacter]|uniref:hypothetical protein n=1 Tax=unclassified Rathayibacter TaxID=2609250 RepID=UPI0011CEB9B4|nr:MULTISPECIES: hypothetical protein [unclassified Rathayibacter]
MDHDDQHSTTSLGRRTILRSAAWVAPTIAVAVAAPLAAASTETGTIATDQDRYVGVRNGDRVDFPVVRGTVTVRNGAMPMTVHLEHTGTTDQVDLRRDAGWSAAIDPSTGRFAFDGIYNAIVGGADPYAYVYIRVLDNNEVDFGQAIAVLAG